MRILLCGGTGYIGCHTHVVLTERGHDVVIADNFSNSSAHVLQRLQRLAGKPVEFHRVDMRDREAMTRLFAVQPFDAVVHFAALKAVGESCERPLDYFENNISGTITLLQVMKDAGVRRLVFSSSATVYGDPESVPVREDARLQVTNPYGRTKLVMEQLIEDLCGSDAAVPRRQPALFQSGRGPRIRIDWRGSVRHPQQPYALHLPGGGGPARETAGIRRRLPDRRRHRRTRLHPCDGPGPGPRRRAGFPGARGPQPDREPGHRSRRSACWSCCAASRRLPVATSPTKSSPAARETWPRSMRIRHWPIGCLAGMRNWMSMPCAATPGAGSR